MLYLQDVFKLVNFVIISNKRQWKSSRYLLNSNAHNFNQMKTPLLYAGYW